MTRSDIPAAAAALLFGLAVQGAAWAEETAAPAAPPAAPTAAAAKPAKPSYADEVVCKTETPTGSRLGGKKTCRTRAAWENAAAEAGRGVSEFQLTADHADYMPGK